MLRKKPIKRKSKVPNPVKRKRNPELYNLVFSDRTMEKMTPVQVIQHINIVSEYPSSSRNPITHPFAFMDPEEILEYVQYFASHGEFLH